MRAVLEKAREWHRPMIIISVDLRKAFDAISVKALIEYVSENPLPLALQLAHAKLAWLPGASKQKISACLEDSGKEAQKAHTFFP